MFLHWANWKKKNRFTCKKTRLGGNFTARVYFCHNFPNLPHIVGQTVTIMFKLSALAITRAKRALSG